MTRAYNDKTWNDEDYDSSEFESFASERPEFLDREPSNRFLAILGTSYGLSALIHIIGLFCLSFLLFFVPKKEKVTRIQARREIRPQVEEFKKPLDLKRRPDVPTPEEIEKPIVELEEEVPEKAKEPKGENMDNIANKNMLGESFSDAHGLAGGAAGAKGNPYGGRWTGKPPGGKTDILVDASLKWLRMHQDRSGRWGAADWHHNCKHARCRGRGHDQGDSRYDVGVTALATLAFLGRGYTHRMGKHKRVVAKALAYLQSKQAQDGSIGFHDGEEIYNHAIATMALCEAFGMARDYRLKKPAQAAVDFCLKAQNPGQGWKYGVKPGSNDTSVTGWMVLALKAAKTAGLKVPEESFDGVKNWLSRVTDERGLAGYHKKGGGSSVIPKQRGQFKELPCMTAVSMLAQLFMGERRSKSQIKGAAKALSMNPPTFDKHNKNSSVNFYYWYYGTYAMFQNGGAKWTKWNKAMQKALIGSVRQSGPEKGSWDGVGEWSIAGGRVYSTAINVLTLEIYYRYERIQSR